MKIALLGYGTMGKAIEKIVNERGDEIVLKLSSDLPEHWLQSLKTADVAIEFSTPDSVTENVRTCMKFNVPVVIGTTGWHDQFELISAECKALNASVFYASNYSIGVNIFFQLNKTFAALMEHFPQYTAGIEETHHIRKKDAPSGTAITLANDLVAAHSGYDSWANSPSLNGNEVYINSVRRDDVPGTHTIGYTSGTDRIEITHTAFNREGFALGALEAARFLVGKKGLFTMSDLLKLPYVHGH